MSSELVKVSQAKRSNPIPVIILWITLTLLAIAFFPYLSLNTNRALQKQDRDHEETLTELNQEITRLKQSLAEVTKPAPQQDKEASKIAPYSGCLLSAQDYQNRYMSGGNVSDLICLNKAIKRELKIR